VVVVMFDGFAPAMLDATHPTPNFDRLKREGAWSRHLVPAFPTLSLINHMTFATGCWPAHHGVVSNTFFDPERGWFSHVTDQDDAGWRTGCETMWEAAERQGIHAAVFNFVDRWRGKTQLASAVNPEVPWKDHEDDETILHRAFAALKDNRPGHARLIALYFDFPDSVAHGNGVTGAKTQDAVRRADAIVGRLLAALKALPPGREGTLLVGTDHGMRDTTGFINVTRLMNAYDIHAKAAVDGASTFLYLDKGESAGRVRKALSGYGYAFSVYPTGHTPPFARLGTGARVGDLMLVANPPYRMLDANALPWWVSGLGGNWLWSPVVNTGPGVVPSTHGYDPAVTEMHGIFYLWGAGVRRGEIRRLDQIDVHPTVMKLLGLQPGRPMDGHAIAAVRP
jgi:predicted AlkP superfamily pyrophosphatase or phosphodiesterase